LLLTDWRKWRQNVHSLTMEVDQATS